MKPLILVTQLVGAGVGTWGAQLTVQSCSPFLSFQPQLLVTMWTQLVPRGAECQCPTFMKSRGDQVLISGPSTIPTNLDPDAPFITVLQVRKQGLSGDTCVT